VGVEQQGHTLRVSERIRVYYTFGNHMHWVDMEWLWGYHVLPGSIQDMLRFCKETGAKGCVNFDGVGYEKLAAEAPEALAELREAVQSGTIEPVGCSYGQPYGLFQGGESNIRQRIYGVRTVMRLLGVRPKTFWEEEFDFFPQLPQVLRGCGFEYASLFFQWTWHTPEVPKEDVPVIWWEAPDGSRLLTATRNELNLHQWPEDFEGLLEGLARRDAPSSSSRSAPGRGGAPALILQWLELMPSPDWMCRSEVLLPRMKELLADPRFEVRMTTLGGYLAEWKEEKRPSGKTAPPPTRAYAMHEVWHGMSLGKNGDRMRRLSAEAEREILQAEALAAILGLFGRPYAQWDVYPVWELEEAWRELLQAQHHDNDECEGLCGRMGLRSYEKALAMARAVRNLQLDLAEKRLPKGRGQAASFNLLGWDRTLPSLQGERRARLLRNVPAFGWKTFSASARASGARATERAQDRILLRNGKLEAALYLKEPGMRVASRLDVRLGELTGTVQGKALPYSRVENADTEFGSVHLTLRPSRPNKGWEAAVSVFAEPSPELEAFDLSVHCHPLEGELDPGMNAGWQLPFRPTFTVGQVLADVPLGVYEVRASGKRMRKYPTADWMTSPQWFEEVMHPFTSYSFVDFLAEDGSGVLVLHDGSQQWFLDEDGARCLLSMVDPWDEEKATSDVEAGFRLVPHGPLTNAERMRLAAEFRANGLFPLEAEGTSELADLPQSFSALRLEPSNVLATALYREAEDFAGRSVKRYAGAGMGYPFVLRMVEHDGVPAEIDLVLPGPIAKAFKTNLMGEIESELRPEELTHAERGERPLAAKQEELDRFGIVPQRLRFSMCPHEIVTLYLNLVPGRKQVRDLDAKREVWARVHRVE
jgi:alpha-mannosidase